MQQRLGRFQDRIYPALRIVAGFLFACHGAQKLFGVLGGMGGTGATAEALSKFWFAGIIELVGGTLVALGLFASWAAFLCSGQMAVAYFMVHQGRALFPLQNQGELAALYAWLFLFIAAMGSGRFSLDEIRKG